MKKFLALTSYFLARITLTLISSFTITGYFQKLDFQLFNLVILKFELLSAFLYALCELLEEQAVLCGNNIVFFYENQDRLLCVTSRWMKFTNKLRGGATISKVRGLIKKHMFQKALSLVSCAGPSNWGQGGKEHF